MKHWTIGKRVAFTSGFLCIVILGITATAIINSIRINTLSRYITQANIPSLAAASKINSLQAENMILAHKLLYATPEEKRKTLAEMDEQAKTATEASNRYESCILSDTTAATSRTSRKRRKPTSRPEHSISPCWIPTGKKPRSFSMVR